MPGKSEHSFNLAQAADDLLDYTLLICGKRLPEDGKKFTRRFPAALYPKYVQAIIGAAVEIHQCIIIANEEHDPGERLRLQRKAMGQCIYLNHLTRIAANNGWVSEKQADKWKTLATSIRWSTSNWIQSDSRRLQR